MNESSSFHRVVVFVDGYSAREVFLDDRGMELSATTVAILPPIMSAPPCLLGDNDLTSVFSSVHAPQ